MTDSEKPFVRPDVQMFLDYLNAAPGPKMYELSAPEARSMFATMTALAEVERGEIAEVRDLSCPGPTGLIPLRLYRNDLSVTSGPAVVFFHGGGFVIGDLDSHDSFCAEVARQLNIPVIAVDYRLAPEHPWPAAPDDVEAATRWIAGSPAQLGLDVTGLVLMGDSAGGNLTLVTAMALRDNPSNVPVIAQFPIYPATDSGTDWESYRQFGEGYLLTKESMDWFSDCYAADPNSPRATPMLGPVDGLPATVLLTAGLDPLRDQGRVYADKLKNAGVEVHYSNVPGTIHGFITLRKELPSSNVDIANALATLKAIIANTEVGG